MALDAGTRLGVYEIHGLIGVGGMGEVYRARDSQLKRDVALKVLPSAVAGDAERLARFQREAELLAALNHPNIAQIHGVAESSGTRALVMELVEGPTLAELLASPATVAQAAWNTSTSEGELASDSRFPLAAVLTVARQLAEALDYAHERGIVHRDLKPANVKVTDEGVVKVLDLGLAKGLGPGAPTSAQGHAAANSPTLTSPAFTQAGMILGTAAYMAPEQARGRPVDKRADIWAFGCVVFELLTGRRAFPGEDVSDTLASVLRSEPDWNVLPRDTPPELRRLLERCLQKDPRARLRDIGDARVELSLVRSSDDTNEPREQANDVVLGESAGANRSPAAGTRNFWASLATGAVAGAAITAAALLLIGRQEAPARRTPIRASIVLPPGDELAPPRAGTTIALSPDGRTIAYVGIRDNVEQVFVRRLEDPRPNSLPGTEMASGVTFSPDGEWLAFITRGELRRIAVHTSTVPRVVARGLPATRSASVTWLTDGRILIGTNSGALQQVHSDASEGSLESVGESAPHVIRGQPSPVEVPGSNFVLYLARSAQERALLRLDGTTSTVVTATPLEGPVFRAIQMLRSGDDAWLLGQAESGGTLHAMAIDAETGTPTGAMVPVLDGVLVPGTLTLSLMAAASPSTLAFVPAARSTPEIERALVEVDPTKGQERPVLSGRDNLSYVRMSPDGRRAAVDVRVNGTGDIWLYEIAGRTPTRFATGPEHQTYPLWSGDGRRLIHGSDRGIVSVAVGNASDAQLLYQASREVVPYAVSPDERTLALRLVDEAGDYGIGTLDMTTGSLATFVDGPTSEQNAEFSPDGRWIAYEAEDTGGPEIYVRPFPLQGNTVTQVSREGGQMPLWSRDGKSLYFVNATRHLTRVDVGGAEQLVFGSPEIVIPTPFDMPMVLGRRYDLAPNGHVFYVKGRAASLGNQIDLIFNFDEELRAKVGGSRPR